jgi:hypothetical protein
MPSGIPVATVAIDGGVNAALLCAEMFALSDTELAKVDFIVYDYNAFSALTNLEVFRLIDGGKDFNGVLSQVEVNMGYRVTNPDLVYVHKTATT